MFWEARGKAAVIWSGVKLTNRARICVIDTEKR